MRFEWIIVETITILVESFAVLYFLNRRFHARYNAIWPDITIFLVIMTGSLTSKILGWPPYTYSVILFVLLFTYLLVLKEGRLLQKILGVFMVYAINMAASLVGAGMVALMTNTTYEQTLRTQEMTRVIALIFIKMLQVTVFYALAKKHQPIRNLKRRPVLALCSMAFIDFVCLFLVWYYVQVPDLDNQQHHTHQALIWIAIGFLLHLIALFTIYELFISEEKKNVDLSTNLQRIELEQTFYREIDAMYADMRNWRHDYKTNLIALQAMIEGKEMDQALNFIGQITREPDKVKRTLQTGNLILDAVVSSKFWLADSKGIEVNIQAVSLGMGMDIEDYDFCAIVGNLLDNAIEACERMGKEDGKRFIDISLLAKGRNMVLTIENSFNGKLKRSGSWYSSLKQGKFHGIGLKHVDSIIEKYNGQVVREIKGCLFETCVVLPIFKRK